MARSLQFYNVGCSEAIIMFGDYVLLLYYSKQLSNDKAIKLHEVTIDEYSFRRNRNIPYGDVEWGSPFAHYDPNDMQEVIDFLDTHIIPSLEAENVNMLQQYGGVYGFIDLFYDDTYLNQFIGISDGDVFSDSEDSLQVAFVLKRIRKVLQDSLADGTPMKIIMRG